MKLKWKYMIVSLVLLVALFINLQVGSQFIGISKIISTFIGFQMIMILSFIIIDCQE